MAALLLALIAGASLIAWERFGVRSQRRNDLWRVVHEVCSSDQRALKRPSPCVQVDLARGFAVVPGGLYSDELLLVPTQRIVGIEDPILLDSSTPNYWALAWEARHHLLKGKAIVPDEWIGLAVNSALSRTQDQLHIHIDCISPQVWQALSAHPQIGQGWRKFEPLPGKHYELRPMDVAELRARSPFALLANAVGSDPDMLARETLVLIGARAVRAGPAFYLLRQADHSEPGLSGHGEELLDHSCVGVKHSAPRPV